MKKFWIVLMCAALVLGMTACGSGGQESGAGVNVEKQETPEKSEEEKEEILSYQKSKTSRHVCVSSEEALSTTITS